MTIKIFVEDFKTPWVLTQGNLAIGNFKTEFRNTETVGGVIDNKFYGYGVLTIGGQATANLVI